MQDLWQVELKLEAVIHKKKAKEALKQKMFNLKNFAPMIKLFKI
jgi:hypothetical protein